ncbi:hypothetical protein J6590_077319 [Homalodisca vitripennis]|nr:hypothetical protein J6590_077319 [Homalodisca vitripennis]
MSQRRTPDLVDLGHPPRRAPTPPAAATFFFCIPENVIIEKLPYLSTTQFNLVKSLLPYIVTLSFTFVMPSLMGGLVEEKTSGIKEMMKMMGLKSWVNWVNWLVYSMVVYIPVTLVVTGLLTIDTGSGPPIDANFSIVWIMFFLFTIVFVTFVFALSTFFTNGTIALIVGELLWYVVSIVLDSTFVASPSKFSQVVNVITCLWPPVALQWGLNSINNFQRNSHPWTYSDMFDDGAGGGRVSVGVAIIMMIVDCLLFSIITWYVENVNPGPYGLAKPYTFIFQCFKKSTYDSRTTQTTPLSNKYEAAPRDARVGIRIENLRKTFSRGKVIAVENVNLDIYEGNITALLGHNGAGKTTTMSMISGFITPTKGKVIVKDKNIFDNMEQFRSNLGLCPQHNVLFSFFTVIEHLIFFGMLKGFTRKESREEGMQLLRIWGLEGKRNDAVSKLSGGMKRKLCLSIALIGNPSVLMLDEPTSGLDPESRRQVWDVLLGFRGQRITLITTHFMEEADVLGDRIAIMDHGEVSCYGTSMFLKKLYSTGYQLNVSKADHTPVPPITRAVEQFVSSSGLKVASPTLVTYYINSDQATRFPDLFAALESRRNYLGLTGINVSCSTLEDVFLKVAERTGDETDKNEEIIISDFVGKHKKVSGFRLFFQQLKALVYKRVLSRIRTWFSSLLFILLPILMMIYTVTRFMEADITPLQPELQISVKSFPGVHVAVSSDVQATTSVLMNVLGSTYEGIPTGTDFNSYMKNKIDDNLIQYERQMIAGIKYNSSLFLGEYSQSFYHSSALVLNIVANTLLQQKSAQSSIVISNHPIAIQKSQNICDLSMLAPSHTFLFPMVMTFMSLGMVVQMMAFISFPLKERVSNAKQLQLMTGVSPLMYWFTTFLCDFLVFLITAAIMIGMVYVFQDNSIFSSSNYMGTLVLLFLLYGVSGIAFAYFYSFLSQSSIKASAIFIIINMLVGTVLAVFLALLGRVDNKYDIYTFILNFDPIFAATSAFIHLFTAMYIDGTCLQCGKACFTQDPLQFLETGRDSKNPNGILNFLIFLVVDFVIYFGLVLMIEYGVAKKLWFLISKMWIKADFNDKEEDPNVLIEKEKVNSSQNLQGYSSASVLRVRDLGKKYNNKTVAVRGITFQVGKGECFGLLGVNGAGKTTTFKMLTGEEIPNKGDASVVKYSLRKNKHKFLSQIGYCPQFDAINKLLTGREMLRVYALLRGVPSALCESEVTKWVNIMGLKEYADRPCGTYSGGNKRKLSAAMAFIGEPPVVFLDEPTSGVDPVSRRKLWDVVSKCQQAGQAIVLTSHSMEECETLCSRLTIMVAGQMKCIGSAQFLKQRFGQGYTVKVKLQSTQTDNALKTLKEEMMSLFSNSSIKDEHLGLLDYHIPNPSLSLSELFSKMEQLKKRHNIIEDYNVSDTTLEQVFMFFARTSLPPEKIL